MRYLVPGAALGVNSAHLAFRDNVVAIEVILHLPLDYFLSLHPRVNLGGNLRLVLAYVLVAGDVYLLSCVLGVHLFARRISRARHHNVFLGAMLAASHLQVRTSRQFAVTTSVLLPDAGIEDDVLRLRMLLWHYI